MSIKIGICGYGNIGKGVEAAIKDNPDMELVGVFSRRDPKSIVTKTGAPAFSIDMLENGEADVDVVMLCSGSATDLPKQTPAIAAKYCVVDSFDTHAAIPEHFAAVDEAAKKAGTCALISGGWDPGLFSMLRVLGLCALPNGRTETFWGRGVSQGHSDAIRRIEGVLDARQYTVPVPEAVEAVRNGTAGDLTPRMKHRRECYVVAAENADRKRIEQAIVTMPHYFDEYDTTVTFISQEEMKRDHSEMPHAGLVLRHAETGLSGGHQGLIDFELKMDSNPEFTGSVLLSFARATVKMHQHGASGCFTPLDVPLAYLSPLSREELIKKYL